MHDYPQLAHRIALPSPIRLIQLSPHDEFLSSMDKHRRLQLPNMVTGDLCLETGLDVGDGTRTMYRPGQRHSSYVYSVAQRFPDEWFGTIFVISPLIASLYGVTPKIRNLRHGEMVSACT